MLIALTPAREGSIPPTPSIHRLRPGLPGYLIPFAPLAFGPQRQPRSRKPPSPLVFFLISTHFTATPGIPLPSPALKRHGFLPITGLSPELSGRTCVPACAPFTPNDSGQRLPPTYYRGCWHVVSRGFLRRCSVRLSPIAEDSPLLPPVGVWAVSQSQCGRSPSQAGYRSSPWWASTPPTS